MAEKTALYEFDPVNGQISRTVHVRDAVNEDWEALAADSLYIYIGDIGNNAGNRDSLSIYRVSWVDFQQSDTVNAERIQFKMAEQPPAPLPPNANAYDAEALISWNNELVLFTKNWTLQKSYIYRLPKSPGRYLVQRSDSLNTSFWITGATVRNKDVFLIGYGLTGVKLLHLQNIGSSFSTAVRSQHAVVLSGSIQCEAIAFADTFHFTTEAFNGDPAAYYSDATALHQREVSLPLLLLTPNFGPGPYTLQRKMEQVQVFNAHGQRVNHHLIDKQLHINASPGFYWIHTLSGSRSYLQKIVKW